MRFISSQSLAQVPVKYVSVQLGGGLLAVLYSTVGAVVSLFLSCKVQLMGKLGVNIVLV